MQNLTLGNADDRASQEPDGESPGEAARGRTWQESKKKEGTETTSDTPADECSHDPMMGWLDVTAQNEPLGDAYQRAKRSTDDRTGEGLDRPRADSTSEGESRKEADVRREYPEKPEAPTRELPLESEERAEQGALVPARRGFRLRSSEGTAARHRDATELEDPTGERTSAETRSRIE